MNERMGEILARHAAEIAQKTAARESAAERNRARFPLVSAFLDELKRELDEKAPTTFENPQGHRVKSALEGLERAGRPGLLPGEFAINVRDIILEHRKPVEVSEPVRVRKGKPKTSETWWKNTEADC